MSLQDLYCLQKPRHTGGCYLKAREINWERNEKGGKSTKKRKENFSSAVELARQNGDELYNKNRSLFFSIYVDSGRKRERLCWGIEKE
jgi:hypothetical protein